MEQTKEAFIAQYWGQKVFMMPEWETYNDNSPMPVCEAAFKPFRANGYLSLRSIDQLTDEEKIEFSKIPFPNASLDDKERIKIADKYITDWKISYKMGLHLIQIGICLSDTAVKNGWVKLKEDKG